MYIFGKISLFRCTQYFLSATNFSIGQKQIFLQLLGEATRYCFDKFKNQRISLFASLFSSVFTCRVLVEKEDLFDFCREQCYDLAEHGLESLGQDCGGGVMVVIEGILPQKNCHQTLIFGVRVKVIWLRGAQNTPKTYMGDWGVPKIVPREYLEEQCHRVPRGMEPLPH